MSFKLAIIETHPIQYKAPWFRRLAAEPELEIEVFYAMEPNATQQGAGFGVAFTWDQPLREGYPSRVLRNVSRRPSVDRVRGCDTPELYSVIRRGCWDAVLVNGWVVKSCLQALAAARLARVPCIVRGEANNLRRRPLWKRALHRVLLSQYSGFLCIGRANRDFYRSHGVPESKLFSGPYCVDNERFAAEAAAQAPSRADLRERWGIAAGACCLLFSGKLVPKKHPLDLFEAAASVCASGGRTGPRPHILVAGDGELRAACEAASRRLCVPATFAGFLNQAEIVAAYAAADVLVLPSDAGETWGLVVNEAMACGLPAIVSDQVGCQADLVDATTGRVFRCGDVAGLAGCIRDLAADPAGRRAMADAARRRVSAYSVDAVVEGLLAAVRRVSPASAGRLRSGGGRQT